MKIICSHREVGISIVTIEIPVHCTKERRALIVFLIIMTIRILDLQWDQVKTLDIFL